MTYLKTLAIETGSTQASNVFFWPNKGKGMDTDVNEFNKMEQWTHLQFLTFLKMLLQTRTLRSIFIDVKNCKCRRDEQRRIKRLDDAISTERLEKKR